MTNKYIYFIIIISILCANLAFANVYKSSEIQPQQFNGIIIDYHLSEGLFYENTVSINADSLLGKIDAIWHKGNQYYVKLKLANYDEDIRLSVYNMLGKEVLLIHQNKALPRNIDYSFDSSLLPNGIFICILEGKNYRDAEKFVVSR